MAKIQVYATSWCPYCNRAKALLESKGVTWDEVDLDEEPGRRQEMIERTGGRTSVPQIWIDGDHVGGCDELMALDAAGRLDALLQGNA
ncbi:MAG: glutaredoxin 3 [Myxococcota bacterium]